MNESGRERLKRALESLDVAERESADHVSVNARHHLEIVRQCLEEQLFGALRPAEFRQLRQAAGLSQEALARQLDRTLRQVARYEQGYTSVPREVAERLRDLAKQSGSSGS